jgi:hypothetical protein
MRGTISSRSRSRRSILCVIDAIELRVLLVLQDRRYGKRGAKRGVGWG